VSAVSFPIFLSMISEQADTSLLYWIWTTRYLRIGRLIPYSHDVIRQLKSSGFTCCLVSNAKSSRSASFAAELAIFFVDYAGKPSPKGILKAIEMIGIPASKTVMFGDQIFTDILAANRAGVHSVLVEPYDKKEIFYVRIKRVFEHIVRKSCRF